jgi:ATP-binding cassette subfamily C protein LapB
VIVGVFLIIDGKLSVGALVAATMLAGLVLAPIAGIAAVITRASQSITALQAIDKIMALERERPPGRNFVSRSVDHGSIAFDNVTFKYPNGQENALEKVSFKIAPGERVGIIGRIGSGKTTVGRMLVGFYEPSEGHILVDDVDIRQYDPADLRAGIGFVLQDTDLVLGRLRDNITLGRPSASDEEVLAAARLAGVESFLAGHPLGYDMPIAEGGRSLSGGQKQAIGLARVLIRRPKILFLDEPTAHFDVRSEAEFLDRLKTLAERDMTIIVSTHRMSLLSLVDRLMIFDKGRLVADGPRDAVLAKLQAGQKSPAAPPAGERVQPTKPTIVPSPVKSNASL